MTELDIAFARHLIRTNGLVELRAFLPKKWDSTIIGYYDDADALVVDALRLSDELSASAVYVTANPPVDACRARYEINTAAPRKMSTNDDEIARRTHLYVDADPERIKGVSATGAEKEAARELAIKVGEYLKEQGFAAPIFNDSGNGYHLVYRIDLPADDGGLVADLLKALSARFSTAEAGIDTSVCNASRIMKLPGTMARKGADHEERSHRRARCLRMPDEVATTPEDALRRALADLRPDVPDDKPEPVQAKPGPLNGTIVYGEGPPADEEVRHVLEQINDRPGYREWIRIASGVLDKFGGDVSKAERFLKAWRPEEREGEYARKLAKPLTEITWGTVVHIAKGYGYDPSAYYREWNAARRQNGTARTRETKPFVASNGTRTRTITTVASYAKSGKRTAEQAIEQLAEVDGIPPEESREIVKEVFATPGSAMIMTKSVRNATEGRFAHTDLGMAERFADTYAGRVRYCHPWKSWLVWDGRRWERDETGAARRLMYDLVRSMQKEGAHIEDDQYREAFLRHAVDYQKRAKMEAALAIAENLDGIPVMPDRLDGDAWLLNVENGTIDLRLGRLRPHDPGDLITKLAPVHYDEGATAERFERFVLEIFDGSEGLARYMQRLCGYGATGSVREQIIAVLHGHGSNGKGTLTETLKKILGDYAQAIRPDLLMLKRHSGGASEGEAALHGVRLALTSETGSAGRLDEALVKRLTGADTIRARFLFSNEFEFEPTHKILLATNHRPVIRGTDHAIWRRIHLVPFNVRFDGERKDEELPEKLIAEAPGILNWLVQGCLDWQRNGLQPPDEVASATSSYRAEMDVLAGFIDECCTVHEAFTVGASALYKEYRKWADANGEEVLTQTRFGMQLTERGFERVKGQTVSYRGIGLAAHVSHTHYEP